LAVVLIVVGLALLSLVDAPRRAVDRLATVPAWAQRRRRVPGTAVVPQQRQSVDWRAPVDTLGATMHSMAAKVADLPAAGADFAHHTAGAARRGVARMTSWLLGR
ncbi:MAG TPA: hypothetical protein VMU14_24280, partial [Acidimicrobiales bacterium]|nr:hypothetical protein [Acidimicrobiales bacterium]